MLGETRSTIKTRNEVNDSSLKKKKDSERDALNRNSTKTDISSARRSYNTASPQRLQKSKNLDKGMPPSTSRRLEKHNTPSPLRRSDRVKKDLSSSSSSYKHTAKALGFSEEEKKREKNEKKLIEVVMNSMRAPVELESVCGKRKRMTRNAHAFRKRFNIQKTLEEIVPGKLSVSAAIVDKPRNFLNMKDTLCDHKKLALDSSVKNLDSVESESSISLSRVRDGAVHSESGAKCMSPKDIDDTTEGPDKLCVDSPFMDNGVRESCDGHDVPKDSKTSLESENSTCPARSQDGLGSAEKSMHPKGPETTPPTPASENQTPSEICVLCSKQKIVNSEAPVNELCSCSNTASKNLDSSSTSKDRGDHGATATLESAEKCDERNLLGDPHSDNQTVGHVKPSDGSNSRFREYWLPVQISNTQLEQYCDALLSKSVPLRSSLKNDNFGTLREILSTVRKCCDHPYLVDSFVQQRSIAEGHNAADVFEIGIKASGKLQLLDKMLTEIRNRGSQVLVLFQSIVVGKTSFGDFLDDFLSQRFGPQTYERVEALVNQKKKQVAVNRFNKKETGQFVFLLENRACTSIIKLLSVDTIIIYDSDWNPVNDLRAMQKIFVDSKVEKIKVFRLYSSLTFEERSLILAKKNINIENSLQTSSRATSDSLLMWGASNLFKRLDEYHSTSTDLDISSGQLFLDEVMKEFRSILSESCENIASFSAISKVKLDAGGYKSNIPLLGEAKVELDEEEEPHVFWKNILERKNPQWKHLVSPSPRNRKIVHYFEKSSGELDTENNDTGKKRRRVVDGNLGSASVQMESDGHQAIHVAGPNEWTSVTVPCNQPLHKNGVTSNNNPNGSVGAEVDASNSADRIGLSDDQKSLHSFLQEEMIRLCYILNLSEDVTNTVGKFLEYIIKNHVVSSDSPEIVQAFQISLCWIVSSIMKQKLDKKDSLILAKEHLHYKCKEEQVLSVHSKLRSLKKMYLQMAEAENRDQSIVKKGGSALATEKPEQETLLGQRVAGIYQSAMGEIDNKIIQKYKKYKKQLKKLRKKQEEKIQEFEEIWKKKRLDLEEYHKLDLAFIRTLHDQGAVRTDKLKRLGDRFAMLMQEHNLLKDAQLTNLEAEQLATMNEVKQKAERWLAEAKLDSAEPKQIQQGVDVEPASTTSIADPAKAVECDVPIETTSSLHSQKEMGSTSFASSLLDVEKLSVSGEQVCDETQSVEVPQDTVNKSSNEPREQNVLIVGNQQQISDIEVSVTSELREQNVLIVEKNQQQISHITISATAESQEPNVLIVANQQQISHIEVSATAEPREQNVLIVGNQRQISHIEVSATAELQEQNVLVAGNQQQISNIEVSATAESQEENVLIVGNQQQISCIEVSAMASSDTVTASPSNIHVQDKDAPNIENPEPVDFVKPVESVIESQNIPILENESTSQIEVVDLEPVDTVTSTDELQHNDAQAVENQMIPPIENLELMEQPVPNAPVVEIQSTSTSEVSTSEIADALTPLPLNTEAQSPVNIELTDHISVEVSSSHNQFEAEVLPRESVSQNEENLEVSTNQLDPRSMNSVELPVSSQNNTCISQTVVNGVELPNLTALQLGTDTGHHYGSSNYNVRPIPQVASWIPRPSSDFLEFEPIFKFEFERIRKEEEYLRKGHEDMTVQMKSDFEKEILELRNKYEKKLRDADAEFRMKKNELQKNQIKVLMNGALAKAFRSKCDPALRGTQQGNHFSYIQQLHQQSVQLQHSSRLHPIGPSRTQPSPRPQIPTPSQHAALLSRLHSTRPPPLITGQARTSPPPLVQSVQHPSALFSGPPSRPPLISSITPTRNPRVNGDVRAPAPHLQLFRPISATSSPTTLVQPHQSPTFQSGPGPSQAPHLRPFRHAAATSSPTTPPVQPHQPPTSPGPSQTPHLQPFRYAAANSSPTTPHHPPTSQNRPGPSQVPHLQTFRHATATSSPATPHQPPPVQPHRPQNGLGPSRGEFATHPNSSLSALELLMVMDHRLPMQRSRTAPLPEISSTFAPLDPLDFQVLGNVQGNHTSSADVATNDVVCLSDDE